VTTAVLLLALSLKSGTATTFDEPGRDKWNPGGMACALGMRTAWRGQEARRLAAAGLAVAHKTLPCWTVLLVCLPRTGQCSKATVADWGPARADMDLYAPLSRRLGADGRDLAAWVVTSPSGAPPQRGMPLASRRRARAARC
jgi:hypothetical protein